MNNFTRSSGNAYWHAVTNLTCCSIDLKKMQSHALKAFLVLMLFAFNSTSLFAQNRTTFYEVCIADRPEGLTPEQAMALFPDAECDGTLTVEKTEDLQGTDCGWVVRYSYHLLCDGKEIAVQKLIYEGGDVTPPVMEIPADVTVECDAIPAVGTPTATDNCDDDVEITYDGEVRTGDDCNYTLQRTWTATDNCENSTTLTQTITVQDTQGPELNKGAVVPTGETGLNVCYSNLPEGPSVEEIASLFSDNCNGVNVVKEPVFKGTDCMWKGYINYYITDDCGNPGDTISLYYNGGDTEAPVFVDAPGDIQVDCIDQIPTNYVLQWTDNCSVSDPKGKGLGVDDTSGLGEACEGGVMTRTWTAQDACGNEVTHTQTITVKPAPPVVFDDIQDMTIKCDELDQFVPGTLHYSNGGSGACDISGDAQGVAEDFKDNCGSFTVTYTYEDTCNSISHVQTITVVDEVAPDLVIPADVTVECDAVPAEDPDAASATDNCDTDVEVKYDGETRTNGECDDSYTLTRTWTAEDNCGNTTTLSQTITVQDTTKPVLTIPADETVQCDNVPPIGDATATDNCDANVDVVFVDEKTEPGNCENSYTIIRIWTATDNCGNSTTESQQITVVDTTAPELTIPKDETVECDNVPAVGDATAIDNCDEDVTVTYDGEVRTDGSCENSYTLTRTWTATDNCDNSTTLSQTIKVQDTTDPVLTIPQDVTVECDNVPDAGKASATDNCDQEVDVKYDGETRTDGSCENSYTLTRTWTATDNCNNSTTLSQTITVQDTTDPVITVPQDITVQCNEVPAVGEASATDNCDADVEVDFLKEERIDGDCDDSYRLVRVWIATDNCGNYITGSQTITVIDTTKPVFAGVGDDAKIECPESPVFSEPTASDNCDADVTITFTDDDKTDECGLGSITRTWTAVDNCGNTQTASQTITIEDNVAPVIENVGDDYTVECPDSPKFSEPTVSDACDDKPNLDFEDTPNLDECGLGTITRTWTATDCAGNQSKDSQTITIDDTVAPTINGVEADYTVECPGELVWSNPTATDACDEQPYLRFEESSNLDDCGLGTHTRTWYATDCKGNESTASQTITVVDTTAPVISGVEADYIVECPESPKFSDPSVSDSCDAKPNLDFVDTPNLDDCGLGTITRTWTATDCAGNTSKDSQTITIIDETAPVISGVEEDFTVQCPDEYAFSEPTASDTCDQQPSLTSEDTDTLDACGLGTITRTWTATDCAGNTSTASQTITIEDTTAPVITEVGQDMTIDCPAQPVFSEPKVSDTCDAAPKLEYVDTPNLDECGLGTVTRTWTATDCAGNTSTASQTITIQDITDPIFNEELPKDVTEECDAVTPAVTLTATDTCDTDIKVEFKEEREDGNCAGNYKLIRTWTAADCAGNTIEHVQTVTVQDTTPPVQIGEIPASINEINGCASEAPEPMSTDDFAKLFEDNCSSVVVTLWSSPVGDDCGWSVMHKYTVSDDCGNLLGDFKVYYSGSDETSPELVGVPADTEIACTDAIPAAADVTATDNCDPNVKVHLDESRIDYNCAGNYDIIRTWTAADKCGNPVSATQTIKVRDNEAPVLVKELPEGSNENDLCAPDTDEELANLGVLTEEEFAALYKDNCSGVNVERIINLDGDDCKWIMWVRYLITDDCGNEAQPVKIWYHGADMSAPETTGLCENETMEIPTSEYGVCPADATISVQVGDEISAANPNWTVGGREFTFDGLIPCFTDNCTAQEDLVFSVAGISDDKGECTRIIKITFDVSDKCGNVYKGFVCTFVIIDDEAPVITKADDVVAECDGTDDAFNAWLASNGGHTADDCNKVTWTNDYVSCDDQFTNRMLTSPADFSGAEELVDFEAMGGFPTGEEYAAQGVHFSNSTGFETFDYCDGLGLSMNYGNPQLIDIRFDSKVNRVGFDAASADFDINMEVICMNNGNVIATDILSAGYDCQFFGMESELGFDQIILKNTGDGSNIRFVMDNLRYEGCDSTTEGDNCSNSTKVTFTATDACGNSSSTTSTFTVEDTTAPVFTDADCGTTVDLDFDPNKGPGGKAGFTMLGEYNGNYYYLSDGAMQATVAAPDAIANGGYMATINDAAENTWVYDAVVAAAGGNIRYYIGYTDAAQEGVFVWQDGDPSTYNNWHNGEPNDAGGEDCAEVGFFGSSTWNDINCINQSNRYVLEVKGASLKEKADYTDACAGDGVVTDYYDSQVTYAGTNVNVSINLGFADGPISNGRPGYVGIALDENDQQVGDSTYELYWTDHDDWHLKEITQGGQEIYQGYTWVDSPSCDFNEWGEYSILTGVICDENGITLTATISATVNSFTRTFTATDGCNETECNITYTWNEFGDNQVRTTEIDNDGPDYVHVSNQAQAAPDQGDAKGLELDFTAYPVPFDRDVNVKFNFEFDTDVTIEVHDTKGLLVKSLTLNNVRANSDIKKSFDLSRAGDQVFYITVTTNKGSVTKKVVSSNMKRF